MQPPADSKKLALEIDAFFTEQDVGKGIWLNGQLLYITFLVSRSSGSCAGLVGEAAQGERTCTSCDGSVVTDGVCCGSLGTGETTQVCNGLARGEHCVLSTVLNSPKSLCWK